MSSASQMGGLAKPVSSLGIRRAWRHPYLPSLALIHPLDIVAPPK
jgi:hypothetical protein